MSVAGVRVVEYGTKGDELQDVEGSILKAF